MVSIALSATPYAEKATTDFAPLPSEIILCVLQLRNHFSIGFTLPSLLVLAFLGVQSLGTVCGKHSAALKGFETQAPSF